MKNEIIDLKNKFLLIKNSGWIKSIKENWGGIGLTFEALLGLNNNDFEIPDYNGIELKTKRAYSNTSITLFSYAPEGPSYHEVERIKNLYGYPDSILKRYNVLNTSISANEQTKVGLNYYFKLQIDRNKEKIFLLVYDLNKNLIENSVYWDFDALRQKVYRKLKYLAIAKALVRREGKEEYFKFYKLTVYKLKSFDDFIDALDNGIIRISFKIGVFRDEKNKGKIHDHGTSFNIAENSLKKVYDIIDVY